MTILPNPFLSVSGVPSKAPVGEEDRSPVGPPCPNDPQLPEIAYLIARAFEALEPRFALDEPAFQAALDG